MRSADERLTVSRDYDQVRADIDSPRHLAQYKATKDAEDLPGLGQHYCVECSKWFESEYNLKAHTKGKNHKRRYVMDLERAAARTYWLTICPSIVDSAF